MPPNAWSTTMLALLGLNGCLMPDLSGTLDPGPGTDRDVGFRSNDRGTTSIVVDATDHDAWVGLDLDALSFVAPEEPTWDLAFQRFNVDLQDGLEAAVVDGVDFDALTEVPEEGWAVDEPDADDDGVPEYVFAEWYDYDPETHALSAADHVYVVLTTEGAAIKVVLDSYYDDAGTPARVALRAAVLEEAP